MNPTRVGVARKNDPWEASPHHDARARVGAAGSRRHKPRYLASKLGQAPRQCPQNASGQAPTGSRRRRRRRNGVQGVPAVPAAGSLPSSPRLLGEGGSIYIREQRETIKYCIKCGISQDNLVPKDFTSRAPYTRQLSFWGSSVQGSCSAEPSGLERCQARQHDHQAREPLDEQVCPRRVAALGEQGQAKADELGEGEAGGEEAVPVEV